MARQGYIKWIGVAVLGMVLGLFSTPSAQAHWADMAAMELDLQATDAQAQLTLPTLFFKAADQNQDGTLDTTEFKQHAPAITTLLNTHIQLQINHEPVPLKITPSSALNPKGMSQVHLHWHWQGTVHHQGLRYALFPADAPQAHCLVNLQRDRLNTSLVFDRFHQLHTLTQASLPEQIRMFGTLGLEHIATGYDHLLFLLALLLSSSRLSYLFKIVTAFTLAHSLTLSLAVMNWVSAPSQWVESLIAASIMYVVCVEVLWKKQETPWYVVFGFGLIHGLGFASILQELALPTEELVTSLISFNLGIELGQLTLVLLMWAGLSWLRKKETWFQPVQMAFSLLIVVIAGFWLVERAILS